jgi:hypothetical protein
MHDVIDGAVVRKSDRNQRNRERFMWHEHVIRDRKLSAAAFCFAALVMHDRNLTRKGWVSISIKSAAKRLSLSERATLRARDLLVSRGWLRRLDGPPRTTARYATNGGPAVVGDSTPTVGDDTTGPPAQQVFLPGLSKGKLRVVVDQGSKEVACSE